MPRVPYEIVMVEASRIIIRMVVATSWEESFHYWDLYIAYIGVCGWTDRELDKETLRRVDLNWENTKRKIWN